MNNIDAIQIIENERECVYRANTCDRHCDTCDLVMEDKYIIDAYDKAIHALKYNSKYRKSVRRYKRKYIYIKLALKRAIKEMIDMADADAYSDYQLGFNYGVMTVYKKLKGILNNELSNIRI